MNYEELVKALRCCIQNPPETCVGCTYNIGNNECNVKRMIGDAAAAIEELQAVLKEADKKQAYQHDCICELVAEIEELQAQLPKRGKWIVHTEVKNIYGGICVECPVCGDHFVVLNVSDEKYCRSCGAKMEVQDAKDN